MALPAHADRRPGSRTRHAASLNGSGQWDVEVGTNRYHEVVNRSVGARLAQFSSALNAIRNPPISATTAAWKSAARHASPRRRAAENP